MPQIDMDDSSLLKLMESALRDEWDKYRELLTLSQEQIGLLEASPFEVEPLARLMDLKVTVMDELQVMETRHSEIKARWEERYLDFAPSERHGVRDLRDQTLALIEQLQAMEDTIAQGIQSCHEEVSRQLKSIHQEKKAARAYLNIISGPPRYIDKKN